MAAVAYIQESTWMG